MADSYSSNSRFLEIEPGTSNNTWGTRLNAAAIQLIDEAIAGRTTFTLSGSKTLTTANGATDEARKKILDVTGGTGGTVTIPGVSKEYVVRNASSGNVVITTGSGRTATVATLNIAVIICDGTNCDRGADQADVDACLVAAKAYADALAFDSASGNLPGQAGNAGRYLTTNGTTPSWGALGTASAAATGNVGHTVPFLDGNATVSGAWTFSTQVTSNLFVGPATGISGAVITPSNLTAGRPVWDGSGNLTVLSLIFGGVDSQLRKAGNIVSLDFSLGGHHALNYDVSSGKMTLFTNNIAVFSVDASGNAVFKGTVTQNGSP